MLFNHYNQRLHRWLEKFGFIHDPFAVYEADQERAVIPYLFVDRPYVYHIMGDPSRPQSAFLLARGGEGKSATREIVIYECIYGRLRNRAFPVRYNDFAFLLEQVNGNTDLITTRHHVRAIARAALQTLAEETPPASFNHLESADRDLLRAYAEEYANPIARYKLAQVISGDPVPVDWHLFTPVETLTMLVKLVRQIGPSREQRYEALYILVDRIDETGQGAPGALRLLQPLIVDNSLLGVPGLAFKFFLALDIGQEILRSIRYDRFHLETITWDRKALRDMLEQRLAFFSNNRTEHFEQLCAAPARGNVVERLIAKSQDSPRTLLRLCQALVNYHIERSGEMLIDPKEITTALEEFDRKTDFVQVPTARSQRRALAPSTPEESPSHRLLLDDGGHVWVDGRPLEPPLTNLEFRLLDALYRAAPEIVSTEDLIAAVWGSSPWGTEGNLSGADEQNLRKLIARLRQQLRRSANDQARELVRNAHGRGYWLSIS